jgi:hypothetical protein
MVRAGISVGSGLRVRSGYGPDLFAADVPIEGWRTRLGKRETAIIAVHFPDLPDELQSLAPGFRKGHRPLVVGYDPKRDTTHRRGAEGGRGSGSTRGHAARPRMTRRIQ